MSKLYYRLHSGLYDLRYRFIEHTELPYYHIKDFDQDYYQSIYLYNEIQKEEALKEIVVANSYGKTTERIRGTGNVVDVRTGTRYETMTDIVTNKLVWDFDSEVIAESQADAKELITRLKAEKFKEKNIQVAFSGGKGFSIVVELTDFITPDQLKNVCYKLAEGLKTFDVRIYNPTRIFRVPLTRHSSGLYKTPLPIEALDNKIDDIRDVCKNRINIEDIKDVYSPAELPATLKKVQNVKIAAPMRELSSELVSSISNLDFTTRVKYLTPEKWVLSQGLGYGIGDRHDAYMILAASYRASGHDAEKSYSAIKDADRRHSSIFNRERFSKEELWNNIIATVFSPNWQGGTYGPGHPILARIRAQLPTSLLQEKEIIVDNGFIFNEFKKFSVDIEKNTIKTGIKEFDKQIKLITGTSVSILGSPGSGKTTLSMNILRNTSLNGETALFFSLDMNASLIATNMIKDITGYNIDKVFLLAKENPKEFEEIRKRALEVYKNVGYSFKFGVTPADIRDAIHEYERLHDKKVRLILIDYLENVTPPVSMDPSMASGVVAQHIANICADENVLGITLMQTQKTVKPGEPIENMRSIKGASLIEQGISVGIGIHRPGQSLKYKDYDNYMVANILKNRFGPMGSIPMYFDGEKARVRDLTSTEKLGFQDLLDMIESDKLDEKEQKKNEWKKNNSWD